MPDDGCSQCGSHHAVVVSRQTRWGQPVTMYRCKNCGHVEQAVDDIDEQVDETGSGAAWTLPRCPSCKSADVPVTRTLSPGPPLVQWRKCRQCQHAFKSVGQ